MKLKHISFKIISLVMVMTMLFGMSSTTINAMASQDADEKKIHYVSIGDSMTNGYGFNGYVQGDLADGEFVNGNGGYGENSYPELFYNYLVEQNPGYTVTHGQLASSALRAEDLYYLLGGLEEPADDWFDEILHYTGEKNAEELAEYYQESIKKADIITIGIGNASFGAFLMSRATALIGIMGDPAKKNIYTLDESLVGLLTESQQAIVYDAYEDALEYLLENVDAEIATQYHLTDVAELLAYTVAGFLLGFKGAIEKIVALNPDAEIVLIGLMNTTYGLNLVVNENLSIPVGDYMDSLFSTLNAYIAGVPALMELNGTAAADKINSIEVKLYEELDKIEDKANADIKDLKETANKELAALAEDLKVATGDVKVEIENKIAQIKADLEAAIEEITEAADFESAVVIEKIESTFPDVVGDVVAKPAEYVDSQLKGYVANLKAEAEAAVKALNKAAAEDIAALEANIKNASAEAVAELEAEIAKVEADLDAAIADVEDALDAKVADANAAFETAVADLKAVAEAKYNAAKAEKEAEIYALNAKLALPDAAVEEIKAEIAKLEAELQDIINGINADLAAAIANAEADVQALVAELEAEAQAEIALIEAEAYAKVAALRAEIDLATEDAKAEYAAIKAEIADKYAALKSAAEAKLAALELALEVAVEDQKAAIKAEIAAVKAAYTAAVEALNAEFDALLADLYAAEAAIKAEIYAEIEKIDAALAEAVANVNAKATELINEANDFLNVTVEKSATALINKIDKTKRGVEKEIAKVSAEAEVAVATLKLEAEKQITKIKEEALSHTNSKSNHFYYVADTNPEFICQVFDDMYEAGWDKESDVIKEIGLSVDIVRGRTIKSYNSTLCSIIGAAFAAGINAGIESAVRPQVFAAVKANVAAGVKSSDYGTWIDGSVEGKINALNEEEFIEFLKGKDVKNIILDEYQSDVFAGINASAGEIFEGQTNADKAYELRVEYEINQRLLSTNNFFPEITLADVVAYETAGAYEWEDKWTYNTDNDRKAMSIAVYLALERAIANSVDATEILLTGLENIADMSKLMGVLGGYMPPLGVDGGTGEPLGYPKDITDTMAEYLTSTTLLRGMCKIYGIFKIGDGMCVHPTPKSHEALYNKIVDAYENDRSAIDKTIANLKYAAVVLAGAAYLYHEEAYEEAYKYLREEGYVEKVVKELLKLEETLRDFKDDLADFREYAQPQFRDIIAVLESELSLVVGSPLGGKDGEGDIDRIITLILVADKLDRESRDALEELVEGLELHLVNIEKLVEELETFDYKAEYDRQLGYLLAKLEADLAPIKADLENEINALKTEIENKINAENAKVEAEIERVKGEIEDKINELRTKADEKIAALEANLENASAELKAKIEAEIADIKAELEEKVNELNAELEAKVSELKADLEEKVSELNAELEGLIADVKAEAEKLSADIKAEFDKAVEVLDEQYAKFAALEIEDLKAYLAEALEVIDAFVLAWGERAEAYLLNKLSEIYDEFVNAVVEIVEYYAPKAADYVYNWLYNNPDKVIAFFDEYGDDIVGFIVDNAEIFGAVIGFVAINYGEDIVNFLLDNADVILPAIAEWYSIHGENTWALLAVYFNAIVEYYNLDDKAWEALHYAFDAVVKYVGEIVESIFNGEYTLDDLANLFDMIEAKFAELDALLGGKLSEALGAIKGILGDAFAELKDAVLEQLGDLRDLLVDALKDASAEVRAQIMKQLDVVDGMIRDFANYAFGEILHQLDVLKNMIWDALKDTDDKIRDEVSDVIDDIKDKLEDITEDVKNELVSKLESLQNAINAIFNKLSTAVKEKLAREIEALKNMLLNIGNYTEAEIREQLANLDAALKNAAKELAASALDRIYAVVEKTMKVEYTVTNDSYYVALNGGNADYAKLVAEALGLTEEQVGYTTWDDIDYDVLKAADLITVGFDENEVNGFALRQVIAYIVEFINSDVKDAISENENAEFIIGALDEIVVSMFPGYEVADMDWAKFVGADNVHYVDEALDSIRAELVKADVEGQVLGAMVDALGDYGAAIDENGALALNYGGFELAINVPVLDFVMFAVESYLYSVVEFSYNYGNLIYNLYKTNSDATVVLLGATNPFDMELEIGETTVNIGDAYKYVALATSIQPLAYALVSANVGFADISDAESIYDDFVESEAAEYSVLNFLALYLGDNTITDASEDGNAYIAEQILKVIDVTKIINPDEPDEPDEPDVPECDHEYDNDCDPDCNKCGEIRDAGHSFKVWIIVKAATKDEDGLRRSTCEKCGAVKEAVIPALTENGGNGSATGCKHHYDNACDAECNKCGETREVPGHAFGEWETVVEATKDYEGLQRRYCSACGVYEENTIAVLEGGLGAGAIVGVVLGSTATAGVGGFSVYWFGIKHSTFAALGVALKATFSKKGMASLGASIAKFFKNIGKKG